MAGNISYKVAVFVTVKPRWKSGGKTWKLTFLAYFYARNGRKNPSDFPNVREDFLSFHYLAAGPITVQHGGEREFSSLVVLGL